MTLANCLKVNIKLILIGSVTPVLFWGCGGDSSAKAPAPSLIIKNSCVEGAKWSYSAEGAVHSTAVVDDNFVYFGDSAGYLVALNKVNGSLQWKTNIQGALDSKLMVHESTLIVVSDIGKMVAVNTATGKELWQVPLGEMERSEYDYHISSPVIDRGVAYIGTESGSLIGVDIDSGRITWQVQLNSPAHSQPVITKGNICISSMDDVSCVALDTKEVIWQQPVQWASSPASDGNTIVVGSRESYAVFAFDLKSGEERWQEAVVDWPPGDPIIHDGITYIGSSDNHAFWAIDMITGEKLWRADTVANVFTKAVKVDDAIIFSSGFAYDTPGFGVVKAVNLSGEELWSVPGCNFFSSPVIDQSMLYIGSDDGFVYAIDMNEQI